MIAVPLIILALTIAGAVLAVHTKINSFAATDDGTYAIGPHVRLRLMGGVETPAHAEAASRAIDSVLTARFGEWWKRVDLIIEWLPYGAVVTGPFVKTGFVTRGDRTAAVLQPKPPITEETSKQIARVVGTIRIDKPWPWSKFKRLTIVIMDGRVGASKREVLAGEDNGKPRMGIEKTALFYEVAWRLVPLCLQGMGGAEVQTGKQDAEHRAIEAEMQAAFKNFSMGDA